MSALPPISDLTRTYCAAFDHPHRRDCYAIFDRSRLSPIPPEYPDNSKHAGRNQNENQRRIFDPSNRRDAERHDQPKKTDLPGKDMNAGGKGAQRQQGENSDARRVSVKIPLNARQQH